MQLTFDLLFGTNASQFELPNPIAAGTAFSRISLDATIANSEISSRIHEVIDKKTNRWGILLEVLSAGDRGKTDHVDSSDRVLLSAREIIQDSIPDATFAAWGDFLLALHTAPPIKFSPVVNAMTISRFWNDSSGDLVGLLAAERRISECVGLEKETLLQSHLHEGVPANHLRLWRGLVLDTAGDRSGACREFLELVKHNFHWRGAWYLARSLSETPSRDYAAELLRIVLQCRPDFEPARQLATALTPPNRRKELAPCHLSASGEALVMTKLIYPDDIVFDVGANAGQWTKQLLEIRNDVSIHAFEPVRSTFEEFEAQTSAILPKSNSTKIVPNNLALGRSAGKQEFHHYPGNSTMSSLYRRSEKAVGAIESVKEEIETITLDEYCAKNKVPHVNFLKIDVEGAEFDVLRGSSRMLTEGRIDFVQFEYGGTYLDAGTTLKQVYDYLVEFKYHIFIISTKGLQHIKTFHQGLETYQYGNLLAVHDRLLGLFFSGGKKQIELGPVLNEYGIIPRGIIHVGAHEGEELAKYRKLGVQDIVLIEANPDVFQRLNEKVKSDSQVRTTNCAITDFNGTVDLHITNMDQSSSILSLAQHAKIYPQIRECDAVTVPAKTLDTLNDELGLTARRYNILSMDIQGAELSALKGASHLLPQIDLIYTEVNWKELYKGGALIYDIDAFLENRGFLRVATLSPYHPSWGDAIYVRKKFTERKTPRRTSSAEVVLK